MVLQIILLLCTINIVYISFKTKLLDNNLHFGFKTNDWLNYYCIIIINNNPKTNNLKTNK